MAKEFNNSPRTYLRVNKDGLLYVKSNEPKEGYEEVVLKNGNSVYHKTFGSTEDGNLSYIGISEKEFPTGKVKLLELSIQGEDSTDQITFNLFKQNGNLDDYAKNIATLLPNLDFSKKINIVPSRKKTNGYVQRNVFINYPESTGDGNYVKFAHMYGKDGDIPMADKVTGVDGSIKYDFTKQDSFLYKILLEQIERFKAFKGTNSTPEPSSSNNENTQPSQTAQGSTTPDDLNNSDDDDLPF